MTTAADYVRETLNAARYRVELGDANNELQGIPAPLLAWLPTANAAHTPRAKLAALRDAVRIVAAVNRTDLILSAWLPDARRALAEGEAAIS